MRNGIGKNISSLTVLSSGGLWDRVLLGYGRMSNVNKQDGPKKFAA